MIDLRSDTVTLPTPAMRAAMAGAEVGDDVYGEDPTVNRLQEKAAEMMGKEAGLFVPSGTMANLVAVLSHCRRGDSVILGEGAHSWLYETGGISALAGILPIIVGRGGTFTWADVEKNARGGNIHLAPTTLIMMENTHNQGGGIVFPQADIMEIGRNAEFWGLHTHIDGARIFNAAVALQTPARELAAPVESISFCLSKGLGCPVGSVLTGSKDFIERARRFRKMLGGGMRQAGILAAAGLYALEHHIERLAEDHENARLLARLLADLPGLRLDLSRVQTNMVFMEVTRPAVNALELAGRLKTEGLLINPVGKNFLRAVTHLGITPEHITRAAEIITKALR